MTDDVELRLVKARMKLLFKHPFFGQLALRMPFVDVTDQGWCPTAATDFKNIYYNVNFINKLDQDELVFLVAHEVGHCVFEHLISRKERNPTLWNMAGDYVINLMLVNNKIGRLPTSVPGLYDTKYEKYITEQVYEDLVKNKAVPKDTLDFHIDMIAGRDGDSSDDKSKVPTLDAANAKALSDEIRQAVLQAAASSSKLPVEISRLISDLTESKMDWKEHIRATIESNFKNDFTWMRPNRKGWHMNAVLPGMTTGDEISVAIGIDTSGSISQKTLRDFVSEVNGIMQQFDAYTIKIWQFDTNVYGYETFTHDDGKNILDYKIKGGGGTDFDANWKFMKRNEIVPDQFIMFTDMYPSGSWGDEMYCDTLFVAHGTKTIVAPFGTTIYYE